MASLFGHQWTSAYGAEIDPDRVWEAALSGVEIDQIRHGMRACIQQCLEWPPSAPKFRGMCLGESDVSWEHRRIEAADRERAKRQALPDLTGQEARDQSARETLGSVMSMLGRKSRSAA